jgi:hypothetical protein
MKSLLKSTVSLVLMTSQLGLSATAFGAPSNSPSPEAVLLENAIVIRGSGLSSDAVQSQINAAVASYADNSPTDGRSERLQQALVDMGIYTPSQAQELASEAQTAAGSMTTRSNDIDQSKLSAELTQILQTQPLGAEFSGCDFADVVGGVGLIGGFGVAVGGFVTLLVGHHIRGETESCVEETVTSTQGGITSTPGSISGQGTITTSKQNVCTRSLNASTNIHSGDVDEQHGRFVTELGAYMLAAGALGLILDSTGSCNN